MKSGASILVVADEEDTRHLASHTLERMGYEVLAVRTGPEILRAMASQSFALAVVDLKTRASRQKAVREMHRSDPEMRIIVVTDSPDWRTDALQVATQGWLCKPYRLEQLRLLVGQVLAGAGQEKP